MYQYILSYNKNNSVTHGGIKQIMWPGSLLQMTPARSRVLRGLLGNSAFADEWQSCFTGIGKIRGVDVLQHRCFQ